MQEREHDLGGGEVGELLVAFDRDSPAVVRHLTAVAFQQDHVDGRAVTGHGLVDRVVHHLPDQVVEARRAGRTDVHAGPFADRLQSFQDRDVRCAVGGLGARHGAPSGGVVVQGLEEAENCVV